MKFWVGVTDNSWFNHLVDNDLTEANFWHPSIKVPFSNAPIGMPILFKLKAPNNHIAGGGFFVTYTRLPISMAWDFFGDKNGFDSLEEMAARLGGNNPNKEIGCTIVSETFFLPRQSWISDIPHWAPNLVRGRTYDTDADQESGQLWEEVRARIGDQRGPLSEAVSAHQVLPRGYGVGQIATPRLGQGSFRALITEAYHRRCAITGETTLVALEAAHIKPFSVEQRHEVNNGLLLRADFHRLFDAGLVTVTPDYRVRVSEKIHQLWFNGKAYYQLNNQRLASLPDNALLAPNRDHLAWHLENRFQG